MSLKEERVERQLRGGSDDGENPESLCERDGGGRDGGLRNRAIWFRVLWFAGVEGIRPMLCDGRGAGGSRGRGRERSGAETDTVEAAADDGGGDGREPGGSWRARF